MGNRHGSMGVAINYDADLQASVETACLPVHRQFAWQMSWISTQNC